MKKNDRPRSKKDPKLESIVEEDIESSEKDEDPSVLDIEKALQFKGEESSSSGMSKGNTKNEEQKNQFNKELS